MWLLDANVDVHLVPVLKEFGIPCDTAASRGWKALANGQLVAAAVVAGFDCILTRDRLSRQSAGLTPGICRGPPEARSEALAAISGGFPGGLGHIADPAGYGTGYSLALTWPRSSVPVVLARACEFSARFSADERILLGQGEGSHPDAGPVKRRDTRRQGRSPLRIAAATFQRRKHR